MIDSDFIRRWDEAMLAEVDSQLPDNVPPYVAEHRSVLRPPASREDVDEAERRLGLDLPPSYKEFLGHTDGAFAGALGLVIGSSWNPNGTWHEQGLGFLPVQALTSGQPEMAREWASEGLDGIADPNYRAHLSEWEYLDHERDQDPVHFKTGHYRHCLIISTNHDGSETMLNPLVKQPDGEWEAWDLGTKLPGTYRYSSFEALLQNQVERPPDLTGPPPSVDVVAAATTLDRDDATETERAEAIHDLWISGLYGEEHPRWREEALRLALDPTVDRYLRGTEARNIARTREVESLLMLLDDPEPLVWQPAVPALVYVGEETTRERLLDVLGRRDLDASVVRSLWLRDPLGIAWDAYQVSGNLDLLAFSSRIGHRQAQCEMVARLNDPDLEPERRQALASSVWGPRHASGLADGLVAASRQPGAPIREIAQLLTPIAPDAAVPLWRRVFQDPDLGVYTADAAWNLKSIGTAGALDVLIEASRTEQSYPAAVIDALGRFAEPRAVAATESLVPNDTLLLDIVYALETQRIPEARDALVSLQHIQGLRALARLGDPRAFEPLLEASGSNDPELRREALEGLRDLNDPRASDRLIEILESVRPDSDEAAICAHTLAVMRAPGVVPILQGLLEVSENPHLQNVTSGWLDQLRRTA